MSYDLRQYCKDNDIGCDDVDYEECQRPGTQQPKKQIIRVYVAGPLSPKGLNTKHLAIDYLLNVRNMIEAGKELLLMGLSPFVPGIDYNFFLQLREGEEISEEMIKRYSIDWLLVCDAVLLLPGWIYSGGTKAEIKIAIKNDILIYQSMKELKDAVHQARIS